jgi:hypothetical protein
VGGCVGGWVAGSSSEVQEPDAKGNDVAWLADCMVRVHSPPHPSQCACHYAGPEGSMETDVASGSCILCSRSLVLLLCDGVLQHSRHCNQNASC